MRRLKATLIFVTTTIILGGCSALPLGQANANLTQLYKNKSDNDVVVQSAAIEGLSALAKESGAAAKDTSDPFNKISFYRIAITAAWQAADYTDITLYATEGQALCTADKIDNRDCLMLFVFPDFAAIDETSSTLNRAKPRCTTYSAECLNIYDNAFTNYKNAILRLTDSWPKIGAGSADPIFATEVARRMGEATCKAHRGVIASMNGWGGISGSDFNEKLNGMRGQLKELLLQQKSAGIVDVAVSAFDCQSDINRD